MRCSLLCVVVIIAFCSGVFAAKPKEAKSTKINLKDGSAMVTIPAGSFIMGGDQSLDEKPIHKVYLDAYQIGKREVTVAQYRKFCKATGWKMPKAPKWGWKGSHPMVNVTWDDAAAYCKWAGGRLPTEAEWEKAARGTNGKIYPWGNAWDQKKCANGDLKLTSTAPATSYSTGKSPYGCENMAGNVWEWCADWYDSGYYYASPSRNPKGPSSGNYHVLRGGGWCLNGSIGFQCAHRYGSFGYVPNACTNGFGIRLADDIVPSGAQSRDTDSSKTGKGKTIRDRAVEFR